jgi:LmbE family N-acetylglucosaminyl deacetylase
MMPFAPVASRGAKGGLRILCLGAHSDDVEIGCGGTILSMLAARADVEVHWIVFSATPDRAAEARASACVFLDGAARADVEVLGYRDGFFPYVGGDIKETFEQMKTRLAPDLIFTHRRDDCHQDHRTIAELTWSTFRRHVVLEYEIPKYDADLGQPNLFVPIDEEARARKLELLLRHFGTQRSKSWFSAETFESLMRLRGIECASPTGYAEAFHVRKLTLQLSDRQTA